MANNSLDEFSSFVNQQMQSVEDLNEHLSKAFALIQVATRYDFSDFSKKTIHDYLWVLNDVIGNAYQCSELSLKDVFEACRMVNTAMVAEYNQKAMTP